MSIFAPGFEREERELAEMSVKKLTILGSTGSIGTQALQVIDRHRDEIEVYALVCNHNIDLIARQAKKYNPKYVVVNDPKCYKALKKELGEVACKVLCGEEEVNLVAGDTEADVVLAAMVGFAGLKPTLSAIKSGHTVALANKETLVVGGELVMQESRKYMAPIVPVDSEHSAIFQCIMGEHSNPIQKIFLTASGGPFVDTPTEELSAKTPEEALKHPNWDMGAKVTIDSATLMNKGFEMIEASYLFGIAPANIEVVVHKQSIVHSMVGFADGSIKAQLGVPDMRVPIAYALLFPNRKATGVPLLSMAQMQQLTFEAPRTADFPCLSLAYQAIEEGGTAPCVLNAANEIAVYRFLNKQITFAQIPALSTAMLERFPCRNVHSYEQLRDLDTQVRAESMAWTAIGKR